MSAKKRLVWATTALTSSLLLATAAMAQETTSAVRGEVVDASGAPVADAQVTILHQPSGTRSTVNTDAQGVFDARGLRVGGPYTITVEAPAFEAETLQGINLTLGETTRLNFDLADEAAVEGVVVTAQRDPTANNTGVSTTLDQDDVDAVVSVTRDIRDLARRNILTSQNTRGDGGISIAGSNPRTNRITIDGAQAQDEFGLNTGGLPTRRGPISLEAIEQFVIDAVPTDVENGNFLGGALNVNLRSGGNQFEGSLFLNYLNDGLVGDSIRERPIPTQITQENYGGFLSGPILRDKVFFALSYEFYESADATFTGPVGAGFANEIRGVTQADIDRVVGIFETEYATEFDVGTIPRTTPILDEKYSAKLDWNITDNQRASFTARYALSELFSRTGLGLSSAGLSSQYYLTGEEDYSYTAELNSDWTDRFSTQLRITHRDLERRQDPPSGQEFAAIQVCFSPTSGATGNAGTNISCGTTSVLNFGPDRFRQANFLETANTALFARGTYSLSNQVLKFGYEGRKQDIFNIFVPGSDGVYYFDSVADFQAGRANRFELNNSVTGEATDAAADFAFFIHSFFAQDTIDLSDQLRVTLGARVDGYQSDDRPVLNQNFVARQGFSNQETYDGRSVFMPRSSFEYEPLDWLTVRGGAGLFSGGVPNVIISNSFSNTGVLTAGIDIRRNPNGTFSEVTGTPGFNQGIGATALNINKSDPRFGYDIPSLVEQFQQGATVSPTSETNAISPDFNIPSEYKFFLSGAIEAPPGWASGFAPRLSGLLDNWRLTLDGVFTRTNDGLLFRDFRAQRLIVNGAEQFTPDGRIRYDGIGGTAAQRRAFGITSTNPGSNRDIVAINTDEGRSYTLGLTLNREFDNGFDVLLGYAHQDIEDQTSGARFASTASSLYGTGPAGADPNEEAVGTSFEEVDHRAKFEVGYRRKLFGDLETRFNLFGDYRTGRPVSFLMSDLGFGRNATFGVNRDNFLLYVPDFAADDNPNDLNVGFVTFDSVATRDNFRNAVEFFGLPQGGTVEKGEGTERSPDVFLLDLQVAQELPGILRGHRTRLVFDIQNVLNLISDELGLVEDFNDTNTLVSVQCATATGAAAPTGSPVCDRYRYSSFNPNSTRRSINSDRSLWAIQVRLKYEF